MMTFPTEWKVIAFMFQTTNQSYVIPIINGLICVYIYICYGFNGFPFIIDVKYECIPIKNGLVQLLELP